MSSYDSKQKAVTENLLITSEAQLNEFRNKFDSRISEIMRRIDEHSDQFDQSELSLVDMKKVVGENYFHTQRDIEELKKRLGTEQESVVMRISEQRETIESLFNSLQEKIERHEKTQIREVIKTFQCIYVSLYLFSLYFSQAAWNMLKRRQSLMNVFHYNCRGRSQR